MGAPSEEFLEMIKEAVGVEKEGRRFYLDAAAKITNRLARKTLRALAGDEKQHIRALNEFYRNECRTRACPAVGQLLRRAPGGARKTIFRRPIRTAARLKRDSRVEKIYDLALQLEEQGYKFYKRALRKARAEDEKKFLKFLIEEENDHYRLLLETREFLGNPAEWFLKEEKSIIEG